MNASRSVQIGWQFICCCSFGYFSALPSSLKNISIGTNAENLGFFCKIARLVGIMRCGAVATSQCWTP